MALKAYEQFQEHDTDPDWYMNETADRGGIVVASTVGSGDAQDQAAALVTYAADASGKAPIGMLLTKMVNYDLSKQKQNAYRLEEQVGSKCLLAHRGTFVTNMIYPGITPAAHSPAYVGPSGLLIIAQNASVLETKVGQFLSSKDEDGYAKVRINIP